MYSLPKATELSQQLAKKTLFSKYNLTPKQREMIDGDISRMVLSNVISPAKLPSIHEGSKVKTVYVLQVQLKTKAYHLETFKKLAELIRQNLVFALHCGDEVQFAINYMHFITTSWMKSDTAALEPEGLTMDAVWENLIRSIGELEVITDIPLDEQIRLEEERVEVQRCIDRLTRQMNAEKTPKKKFELHQEITKLKTKL